MSKPTSRLNTILRGLLERARMRKPMQWPMPSVAHAVNVNSQATDAVDGKTIFHTSTNDTRIAKDARTQQLYSDPIRISTLNADHQNVLSASDVSARFAQNNDAVEQDQPSRLSTKNEHAEQQPSRPHDHVLSENNTQTSAPKPPETKKSQNLSDYAQLAVGRAYDSAAETIEAFKNTLSTASASQLKELKDASDKIYTGLMDNVEQVVKKYVPMTSDGKEIRPRSEFEKPKMTSSAPAPSFNQKLENMTEWRRHEDDGTLRPTLAHDQFSTADASKLYMNELEFGASNSNSTFADVTDSAAEPPSSSSSITNRTSKTLSTATTGLIQQFYQLQAQLHAHLQQQSPKPTISKPDDDVDAVDESKNAAAAATSERNNDMQLPGGGNGAFGQSLIERLAVLPISLQMLSATASGFKFPLGTGSNASNTAAAVSAAAAAVAKRHPGQLEPKRKHEIRQRILARRPIDKRTRALVESLVAAQSTLSRLHRVEQLSQHLLKFPEAKYEAVRENVVSCLLQFLHDAQGKSDGTGLATQLHQCLALVGYAFPPRSAGVRILSIDGGGARGVIALEILCDLERRTGKPCHQLFDIMVGVSAGSIIVSALGLYKYSAEETLEIYKHIARELFTRNRVWGVGQLLWSHSYYDTSHYEELLRKLTGERLMVDFIESERSPKVAIVSSVLGPANYGAQVAPYVFRNYSIPTGRLAMHEGACSHKVWQAMRASSAATGLFRELSLDGRIHQDGGILANNPSAIAIHEAHQIWGKNTRLQAIVSVGNGKFLPSHGVFDNETMKILGNATLRSKLGSIVASATDTEAVHQLLLDLLPANHYFRLNPRLREDFPVDVNDPVQIANMLDDARGFVRDNSVMLGQVSQAIDAPRPVSTMALDMFKLWKDRTRKLESGIWYRRPSCGSNVSDAAGNMLQSGAPLGERRKKLW